MAGSTHSAWKKTLKRAEVKLSLLALQALAHPILCPLSTDDIRRSSTCGVSFPFEKDSLFILSTFQIFQTCPNWENSSFSLRVSTLYRPYPHLPVFSVPLSKYLEFVANSNSIKLIDFRVILGFHSICRLIT